VRASESARAERYHPIVQFFADEDDVPLLLNRLNEDPKLAFIVRDDPLLKVHRQVTFFAVPSALARLRSGIPYDANNWDLGPVLKSSAP
jgi:hypothetical protein